jgi:hypothetical protein
MLKQDLENQLQVLRTKWKVFPKSIIDKDWCKFRVDKSKALYLIEQIKKIEADTPIKVEDLTGEQVKKIFETSP